MKFLQLICIERETTDAQVRAAKHPIARYHKIEVRSFVDLGHRG
jgi:hypothetical protein